MLFSGTKSIFTVYINFSRPTFGAYLQFLAIGLSIIAYIYLLDKKLPQATYSVPTIKNVLFAINPLVAISISHGRKLSNLAKTYINNAKYSGYNNSFVFKLAIFYVIGFKANLLIETKMKKFLTMLKSLVLDKYASNIGINGIVINSN